MLKARKLLIILSAWLSMLSFSEPVEKFFDFLFVDPLLSYFKRTPITDVYLFVIVLFVVAWWFGFNRNKRKVLSWSNIGLSILLASYLVIYRFELLGFNHWNFLPLSIFPEIKYVDLVLAFPVILLIYKVIPFEKKNTSVTDDKFTLLDDSHIEKIDQDELSRKGLAEYLSKHILNTKSARSFAIGIDAKWGDGKTSFQQLIKRHLESQDKTIITLEFNPWKSSDENKIVKDFFKAYSSTLKQYDFQLGGMVEKYARQLLAIKGSWWSNLFDDVLNPASNQETNFEEINESLQAIDRKLVVFIDDIDRLNHREIIEVIRLIRNSANFRSTFFIVGFDKEYLHEALSNHSEYGKDDFLEKIFQIQFALSAVPAEVINQKMNEYLIKRLPDFRPEIESIINFKPTQAETFETQLLGTLDGNEFVPKILTNLRDVKRFVNFYSLSVNLVITEVLFRDYFFISLIRFKYPRFVDRLKEQGDKYFDKDFVGVKLNDKEMKNLLTELEIRGKDERLIIDLMTTLFSRERTKSVEARSILHADNFYVYFDNVLNTKGLLFKEFLPEIEKYWKDLRAKTLVWINEKKGSYLIDILQSIDIYVTTSRFEKVIKVWVTLINAGHDRELNFEYLIDLISKGKDRIRSLFDEETLKAFVRGLFNTSSDCHFNTTYICRLILRNYIDNKTDFYFPLDKLEVQKISLERLKQFLGSRSEFDTRVFIFFYYNCWSSKTTESKVVILEDANKLVYEYINKYPLDYLRWAIRPRSTPHMDNEYVFEPFTYQYFDDWDNFEKFLNSHARDKVEFSPMLKFFDDFKQSKYTLFYSEETPQWIEADQHGNAVMKYFKHQTYDAYAEEMEAAYNGRSSRDNQPILILSATYEWPTGQKDVTKNIKEMISKNNNANILVAPATFGIQDPAVGEKKTLKIHYKINGKEEEISGKEGDSIRIK
jgi:hypothetical protein